MKFIISFFFVLLFSCNKTDQGLSPSCSPLSNVTSSLISFNSHILPIFNTNCNNGNCHGGNADGKSFLTHSDVVLVSNTEIIGSINHSTGFSPMPKSQPKLRQGEIDTITTWINEGKPDN